MALKENILEYINTHGAITVHDYMEACVRHYYASRDPFGVEGDFTTAPEISQVFGELIGAWIQDKWQHISASHAIICEAGPGRGTLMKDILRVTRHSGLHECSDVVLIENSPVLQEIQARTLKHAHKRIRWVKAFEDIPKMPLFFIANEFFDALPVRQYVKEEERKVDSTEGNLVFIPEGNVTRELSPLSLLWITQIATHIKQHGGAALIIDYGYVSNEQGDSLQALKHHRYVHPLESPGESDITAHVDFCALQNAALSAGVSASLVTQGTFLAALGAAVRTEQLCSTASASQKEKILSGVERLVSETQMGILFKVLIITSHEENMREQAIS